MMVGFFSLVNGKNLLVGRNPPPVVTRARASTTSVDPHEPSFQYQTAWQPWRANYLLGSVTRRIILTAL
jgi:hypothetical protein